MRGSSGLPGRCIKTVVLTGVGCWSIRDQWAEIQRLSEFEFPELAVAAGMVMLRLFRTIGLVMLILGLADYALRVPAVRIRSPDDARGTARGPADDGGRHGRAIPADASCPGMARRCSRAAGRGQPDRLWDRRPDRGAGRWPSSAPGDGPDHGPGKHWAPGAALDLPGQECLRLMRESCASPLATHASSGTLSHASLPAAVASDLAASWPQG